MIINKLKPCCNDCNLIDIQVSTERDSVRTTDTGNDLISICDTAIWCGHYYVCKKYVECDKEPSKI